MVWMRALDPRMETIPSVFAGTRRLIPFSWAWMAPTTDSAEIVLRGEGTGRQRHQWDKICPLAVRAVLPARQPAQVAAISKPAVRARQSLEGNCFLWWDLLPRARVQPTVLGEASCHMVSRRAGRRAEAETTTASNWSNQVRSRARRPPQATRTINRHALILRIDLSLFLLASMIVLMGS